MEQEKNKKKFQKKTFYSKEYNSSLEEEDDRDNVIGDVLFMDFDNSEQEEFELEGEIDLRDDLICALEELSKERKKNKKLMKEAQKSNSKELEQIISDLKIQAEEDKKIKETVMNQLQ